MKKHPLLLSLLAAALSLPLSAAELSFSGKLPDPHHWTIENQETDPDNLFIRLTDGGANQHVEFIDQTPSSFLALRAKLPEQVAHEMRTQGFVLKSRMRLALIPEEPGNSIDISFRLPECDGLNLHLSRNAQSGKLSIRSWDSIAKEHRHYTASTESESFFDVEVAFTPDNSTHTAGTLTVSLDGIKAYQCAIAFSEHSADSSALISSGNANSTNRLSLVLFEAFELKIQ